MSISSPASSPDSLGPDGRRKPHVALLATGSPGSPYRDGESPLRLRRDELLAGWRRVLGPHRDVLAGIYAARRARIAAGLVGVVGALAIVLQAFFSLAGRDGEPRMIPIGRLTETLIGSVLVLLPLYCAVYFVARAHLVRVLDDMLRPGPDPAADIARLEAQKPGLELVEHVDRLEHPSVALPLIAWGLLAPLSIHGLVAAPFMGSERFLHDFDGWIKASLLLAGVAHLTLLVMTCHFASQLRAWQVGDEVARLPSARSVFMVTAVAGLFPGAIMFLIPPVLIAVTGVTFVPWTFNHMKWRILEERAQLENASGAANAGP